MPKWTNRYTEARRHAKGALGVAKKLFDYVDTGSGRPSEKERALYAAITVFLYGIWENYVEQLAIELIRHISGSIEPSRVPQSVRNLLEKKPTWDLLIDPGWRSLWAQEVEREAIGSNTGGYGLNTAKSNNVNKLFQVVGIENIMSHMNNFPEEKLPSHILESLTIASTEGKVRETLDSFVKLRGEIVHTGKAPTSLRKQHIGEWRDFIDQLIDSFDKTCRELSGNLLRGDSPAS